MRGAEHVELEAVNAAPAAESCQRSGFGLERLERRVRAQSFCKLAEFMVSSLKRIPLPENNSALGA
jgi:hypothetical protein